MNGFKLETPAVLQQRRALESKNRDIEEFALAHPMEWFIVHELPKHRAPGKRFSGAFYERKYRTKTVDGKRVCVAYLRYVGPT